MIKENEELNPHIEELEGYALRLFDFIVDNYNKNITQLRQLEFNCLFCVYSDKINYICDTFNVQEEDLAEHLIDNDEIEQISQGNPNKENALDLFMDYINGFMLNIENAIPKGEPN